MSETIDKLVKTIKSRKGNDVKSSYTAFLLSKGNDYCLKKLKEDHKTDHSIETDKVVFFPLEETPFSLNPDALKNMNPDDLKKQAEEMMKTMGPEQMEEIQKAFASMSPEEKEEIMRKGKEMGLV